METQKYVTVKEKDTFDKIVDAVSIIGGTAVTAGIMCFGGKRLSRNLNTYTGIFGYTLVNTTAWFVGGVTQNAIKEGIYALRKLKK